MSNTMEAEIKITKTR